MMDLMPSRRSWKMINYGNRYYFLPRDYRAIYVLCDGASLRADGEGEGAADGDGPAAHERDAPAGDGWNDGGGAGWELWRRVRRSAGGDADRSEPAARAELARAGGRGGGAEVTGPAEPREREGAFAERRAEQERDGDRVAMVW